MGWDASRRLLWGSLALLQGLRNSILTISVPELSGRPAGSGVSVGLFTQCPSKAHSPSGWCTSLGTWPGAGTVHGGRAGQEFLEALRHIAGDACAALPLQKVKQSQFSLKPAMFSRMSQPHPGSHFPGGQIPQESFLCHGEKTRKPSQSAVTCEMTGLCRCMKARTSGQGETSLDSG